MCYYSIPVHPEQQKYLKFVWDNKLYQFTCLAQGLACAPRLFTKVMKPVFATLRGKGHLSSGYLDDSFLVGYSYDECQSNINDTLKLLKDLGFCPNEDKSVLKPTHVLQHLGFILNSREMSVTISEEKVERLKELANTVLGFFRVQIRLVAKLIGHMVSCFPAVEYAELFYWQLEIDKTLALKETKGNFDAHMTLSDRARSDIKWWIANCQISKKAISYGKIDFTMYTDASTLGWGATLGQTTTGGRWSPEGKEYHINYLELKAILLGLQSLCSASTECHIKVLKDNTTAVAYIRNMGGSHSIPCNDMAREIWLWCKDKGIWISISHIPGIDNEIADKASQVFNDQTEWKLDANIFSRITNILGVPDVDMFASRLNYQVLPYVAWRPDPRAIAIDAFTINWSGYSLIYAFPPFSMIPVEPPTHATSKSHRLMYVRYTHAEQSHTLLEYIIYIADSYIINEPRHYNTLSVTKDSDGTSRCRYSGSTMANPGLVSTVYQDFDRRTTVITSEGPHSTFAIRPREVPLTGGKNQTDGLSVIRSALENQGISQAAQELILSSWRQGTQKQYRTYWNKWQCYASEQSINPFNHQLTKF